MNKSLENKTKKKIMITFREGGNNGGPNNSHKRISESWLKEKYEFIPLYIPKGRLGLFNIKIIKNIANQIKREKPDIVHFAGLELIGWYGMLASKFAGIKNTLLAVHGSTSEAVFFNKNIIKKRIMNFVEMVTLRNSRYIYGVSEYVSGWKKIKKHAKNYMGHIYNLPIEKKDNIDPKEDFRKEFGMSEDDILIVSTGRIEIEKGFETLKQIIVENKWYKKIKFVIVGNGSYLNDMKKSIEESTMKENVIFTGFRTDIDNILEDCDIFVICTWHETLCMSVIEACQHKLPVVASNVGGIPEIIEDKKNGFLVEPKDKTCFIKNIEELIENPELRGIMGEEGYELINSKFNADNILNRLDEIYAKILEEK